MPFTAPEQAQKEVQRGGVYYPAAHVILNLVVENYSPDSPPAPKTVFAIPMECSIQRNSYREADTFSVTFDAKDFPLSPENVRGGGLELRVWDTGHLLAEDENITVLARQGVAGGVPPAMIGLFDETSVQYSSAGKKVTISGTDYTGLFTARQWDPTERVPANVRLDKAIQNLMDQVPSAENMRLVVEGVTPGELPVISKTVTRTNKKNKKVAGQTYWDVMYKLALTSGYILFVRGLDVVLTHARTYIAGRDKNYVMTWGKNISSFSMKRKMGRVKGPRVRVISYDDVARKQISAIYPTDNQINQKLSSTTAVESDRENAASRRQGKKVNLPPRVTNEITTMIVYGVRDTKTLAIAAENAYHLKARSEQSVSITTSDISDMGGNSLINAQVGEALYMMFEPHSAELLETQTFAQRLATLRRIGYTEEGVAEQIAKAVEDRGIFSKPFRVKGSRIEYSIDNGVTIEFDLQNFVNLLRESP